MDAYFQEYERVVREGLQKRRELEREQERSLKRSLSTSPMHLEISEEFASIGADAEPLFSSSSDPIRVETSSSSTRARLKEGNRCNL